MKENLLIIIKEFLNVIQSTKNLSDKTITAYRSDLSNFSDFVKEEAYDETTILRYVNHLLHERKLKDSTIKRKLIVLKMFFEYLYNQRYIEENYYQSHTFKFKKEKRLPKTLSIKEVSKLLVSLRDQNSKVKSSYAVWKTARNLALMDILISTEFVLLEHRKFP